ncbi:hypothetical protein RB598_009327 [Gaeumannomyces tritici]
MGGQERSVGHELARVLPKDGKKWWQKPEHLKLNICLILLMFLTSSNGFDGSIMNGLLALPQWRTFMSEPKGAWLGFINAIYSLGAAITFPVAAMISNKWGRKPGIWASVFVAFIGTAVQAAAPNEGTFIAGRLLMGLSQGLSLGGPLLIAEVAYPTERAVISNLYNCGWYVGAVIAAWATFGTRNLETSAAWRIPSGLMALLPALIIPSLLMIDESPRWLVSVGRVDEARRNLARSHIGSEADVDHPLIVFEMAEIEQTIAAEREAKEKTSWSDLWSTPGNRHRLWISISIGVFSQFVGNGVVSYYLALVLDSVGIRGVTEQTLISALMQVWNLFWSSGAAFLIDRIGRRPLFLASGIIMLVSYIIITGLSGSFAETKHTPTGLAVVPFLFVYFLGYDIALTPLLVSYPVEIWPYALRARGLSVTLVTALFVLFFNTFVNPIALDAISWKYYIVFVAVLVAFVLSVYFTYPETRGRTLETMAELFDGDSAAVAHITAEDMLVKTKGDNAPPTYPKKTGDDNGLAPVTGASAGGEHIEEVARLSSSDEDLRKKPGSEKQ